MRHFHKCRHWRFNTWGWKGNSPPKPRQCHHFILLSLGWPFFPLLGKLMSLLCFFLQSDVDLSPVSSCSCPGSACRWLTWVITTTTCAGWSSYCQTTFAASNSGDTSVCRPSPSCWTSDALTGPPTQSSSCQTCVHISPECGPPHSSGGWPPPATGGFTTHTESGRKRTVPPWTSRSTKGYLPGYIRVILQQNLFCNKIRVYF